MNIRIFEHNGAPEYAIIPFHEWVTIIDCLEERIFGKWAKVSGHEMDR